MITEVVHCKKEPYDVYVGRPSPYGNPYIVGTDGDREEVIHKFREYFMGNKELQARALKECRGKKLGCWCAPQSCHADVIAEFVNTYYNDGETTAIYPNRVEDKEYVEEVYGFKEFGDKDMVFESPTGLQLAKGYERIVYGDHGPYLEFTKDQINFDNWQNRREAVTPYYYGIWFPKDGSPIQLYEQIRDVKHLPNPPKGKDSFRGDREEGYADYKPGYLYIGVKSFKPNKRTLFD